MPKDHTEKNKNPERKTKKAKRPGSISVLLDKFGKGNRWEKEAQYLESLENNGIDQPSNKSVLRDKFGKGNRWEQETAHLESKEKKSIPEHEVEKVEATVSAIENEVWKEMVDGADWLEGEIHDTEARVEALGEGRDTALAEEFKTAHADIAAIQASLDGKVTPANEDTEASVIIDQSLLDDTEEEPTVIVDQALLDEAEAAKNAKTPKEEMVHPKDMTAVSVKPKRLDGTTSSEPLAEPAITRPIEVKSPEPAAVAAPVETKATYKKETITETITRLSEEWSNELDALDKRERITDTDSFYHLKSLFTFADTLEMEGKLPPSMTPLVHDMKSHFVSVRDAITNNEIDLDTLVSEHLSNQGSLTPEEQLNQIAQFGKNQETFIDSQDQIFHTIDELMTMLYRVSSKLREWDDLMSDPAAQDQSTEANRFSNSLDTLKETLHRQRNNYLDNLQPKEAVLISALQDQIDTVPAEQAA